MKTLLAVIACTALTGCVSHRIIGSTEASPRTELRVRFATPRALTFRSGDSAVLALDDVVELHGHVVSPSRDSIKVAAKTAQSALAGSQRFGTGTTATFALADARIEEVRVHKAATIVLVTALVFGALLLFAVATYEEPPPPPPPEPKPK